MSPQYLLNVWEASSAAGRKPAADPQLNSDQDKDFRAWQIRQVVMTGKFCVQHPKIAATEQCKRCGGFMCPTCDFSFPGNLHLCPTCVSNTNEGLTPRRKKFLIWSYVLAIWATIGMACLVSGALSGLASNKEDTAALGYILLFFVLGPAITGLSLGVTAKSSRMGNPASLWIAIIWNAILVASFVLLMIIGLSK